MANEIKKIQDNLKKAKKLWDVVSPIKDAAETLIDLLEKFFESASGNLIKHANPSLHECIRLGLTFQDYTKQFQDNGVFKDSNYFIQEYTSVSVGNTEANQAALNKLHELEKFLEAMIEMSDASINLTEAIFLLVTPGAGANTVNQGANAEAKKVAITKFTASSSEVNKILPNVRNAIDAVKNM